MSEITKTMVSSRKKRILLANTQYSERYFSPIIEGRKQLPENSDTLMEITPNFEFYTLLNYLSRLNENGNISRIYRPHKISPTDSHH